LNDVPSSLILETWSKLFRFLLQLINRDLSHKHREIFSRSLFSASITHSYVSLIGQSELFISTNIVDICSVILLNRILATLTVLGTLSISLLNWLDLLNKVLVFVEKFIGLNSCDHVNGNVRCLMLESTMNIDL